MSQGEGRSLSAAAIASHLACRHLTQLERQRRSGELKVALPKDPRLEAMKARGLEHEAHYVQQLTEAGRRVVTLDGNRDPAKTLAAMRDGAEVIVQAALGNDAMQGIADILLRTDAPSDLGTFSYEPVDTKLASETKAGTILQLCTYALLLEQMQGQLPEKIHVVTPLGEEHYRTADFGAYFRIVRAQLETALRAEPPPATYPEPCAHCDVCTYWRHCQDQRIADDHLSLVAGLHTTHRRELERQQITTMTGLADVDGVLPEDPERGSRDTYRRLGHQARLQVAARTLPLPPVDRLPVEEGRGFRRLPDPSTGDLFLDFEGDPFVGEKGREYLTGWTSRETGASRYEQIWALHAAEEKAALIAFLDEVTAVMQRHPTMHVYHFGAYEPAALKRLCARHDTHGEVLDALLRGQRFVDLHTIVRESMRIGIDRYGLKQLEPLHSFARTFELHDASVACRDLELALELGHHDNIDDALRAEVADYNREDCESTASLRDWLELQRMEAIDAGIDIPRPELQATEAGEKVSERDARIAALKEKLTDELPEDPDDYSEDQCARALLATMLGYFRQEDKNAWWEHYRLRELAHEEHLGEREVVAELEFVELLPKQGRQTNVRGVFRFPPQDTAIEAGKSAYYTAVEDPVEPPKSTKIKVEAVDLATRQVTLSMNKAAAATPPTAVFRDQVVPAETVEASLLAFAEHVVGHGFDDLGPYAAAGDLLRRLPPRRGAATGQPLRRDDEPTLEAATRLCLELDGGVLPIQGPPGSGKTYSGSHAIVALAKAGKKVGITAVSHKVVDNLLASVAKAAKEAKVALRLVHCDKGEGPRGIDYTSNADAIAAISGAAIVGGTAWLWSSARAEDKLDYLFVDEAGQMSLAQTLACARASKNLVLLGDPQQLEQPSRGAHPEGADVATLVHVVGSGHATLDNRQGLFLDKTWRLPPPICAFTSELYYEGRLAPIAGCEGQRVDGNEIVAGAGMFLHEVPHRGNQASSPEEVEAISKLVSQILQPDATWTNRDGNQQPLLAKHVMVIAPYNAQVGALRRALAPLGVMAVGTVDKFQGQQAPVVIYSCTSSSPDDAPRGLSFLYDPHRLNVATSRARCAFVLVASPALFTPEVKTPEQMRWANGMCRFREMAICV